jgi:hypothetical protein
VATLLSRDDYDQFRVAAVDPATLRCADVEATLKRLAAASGGQLALEKFADSFLGRPIYLATIGSGPRRVLLWSQMHGDEPTHTAVLLDLLSYFTRTPSQPLAADILANCTLLMLPMLNPDGAEAVTRFNAQGIDINRDARRLASPEGRALRRAVETLKPDFGFNLHNQNARTTVGTPPLPAAVAVLAPPPDRARTETPAMLRGKQMCTRFVETVRPFAEGMIARYDDTYEPRAFGDTIQASGTATMLVEAGGWPDTDYEPLTRLHFHGLLHTLHAIATDAYRQADITIYTSLPESNSTPVFDCIIKGAHALDGRAGAVFQTDLTINQSNGTRLDRTSRRDGRFVEIGDLDRERGKVAIDASASLVVPGRIVVLDHFTPAIAAKPDVLDEQLAAGVTTLIGSIDITDRAALDAIAKIEKTPINVGFVARLDDTRALSPSELIECVLAAVSRGVLGVVGDRVDASVRQYCDWFGVPVLRREQLSPPAKAASYAELSAEAWLLRERLGLPAVRGRVGRDCFADLQFFAVDTPADAAGPPDWKRLQRVMVSGETVWENGKRTGSNPGVLLRGR